VPWQEGLRVELNLDLSKQTEKAPGKSRWHVAVQVVDRYWDLFLVKHLSSSYSGY
jgi:hypothetical protein